MPAPGSDGGFSQVGTAGSFDPWAVPPILGSTPDAQRMNIPGLPRTSSADDSGMWESMLPAGFSFTGAGSVRVAGLDVMGARVFDGASKRFLSTDPLAQVPGTGFFADVYAFCGNNPVGLMDPWGLKPMSPDEFQKYSQEQYDKFWKGVRNVGEWALAGTMIVVGAALSIISYAGPIGAILGGAAGGALLGMGTEMLIQKIEGREELDGGAILREGAIGAVSGAAGGGAGAAMKSIGKVERGVKAANAASKGKKAAEAASKGVAAEQKAQKLSPMRKALSSQYSQDVAKGTVSNGVSTAETYRYNSMASGNFDPVAYLGAGSAGAGTGLMMSTFTGGLNRGVTGVAPNMGRGSQALVKGTINAAGAYGTANANLGLSEALKPKEARKSGEDMLKASGRSSTSAEIKSVAKDTASYIKGFRK